MSRVTRDSFVDGAAGRSLDVGALDAEARAALQKAGLSEAELRDIAGQDGVISGDQEMGKLFDFIDRADRDGSFRSIQTTRQDGGQQVATRSGELYEALKDQIERSRVGGGPSPAPAPQPKPPSSGGAPVEAPKENRASAGRAGRREPEGRVANETAPATPAERDQAIASLTAQGFTDIHLASNTPYFNQADRRWDGESYPKKPPEKDKDGNPKVRTYKDAGCAPSALAMADVALRGKGATPLTVGQFAVDNGYSGKPGSHGSDAHGLGKAWAKENGLTYTPAREKSAKENVDILRDGLMSGGVGVIGVGVDEKTKEGHFTAKGHIMVVNGYAKDKDGKEWFFVVNPGRNDQTTGKVLKTDANVVQDRSLHHGAGQLMISREQLEKEMKHAFVLHKAAD